MAAAVLSGFDSTAGDDGGESAPRTGTASSLAGTSSMPSRSPVNDSPAGARKGGRVPQSDTGNDDAGSLDSGGSGPRGPGLGSTDGASGSGYAAPGPGRGARAFTDSEADSGAGGGSAAATSDAGAGVSDSAAGGTGGAAVAVNQATFGDGDQDAPVTTLEFRPTYLLGGLCTPPPPRFAAQYPTMLRYRVRVPPCPWPTPVRRSPRAPPLQPCRPVPPADKPGRV